MINIIPRHTKSNENPDTPAKNSSPTRSHLIAKIKKNINIPLNLIRIKEMQFTNLHVPFNVSREQ